MFETAVLSSGPSTKRVWATCAGFTGQALLITFALLAPMIWPQAIPHVVWAATLVPPSPPPPPPPPPGEQLMSRPARVIRTQFRDTQLMAPNYVPPRALQIDDPPAELAGNASGPGVQGGILGGTRDGAVGGVLADLLKPAQPVIPMVKPPVRATVTTPPSTPAKPPRISVVQLATPIRRVEPVYPALARQARISGTVELIGVLGTDGRIRELKVVSGHALLINAALDAVRQWVYAPTLLNGQPVEVQAPIQVNFILSR